MLVIRLRRIGKKGKPSYRLVVSEKTLTPTGKFLVDLGSYNPHTKKAILDKDKIAQWLGNGAQPSNSVSRILENEKVKHNLVGFVKKNKKSKQEPAEETKPATPAAAPVAEVVVEEAPVAEEVAEATPEAPAEEPATDAKSE